MIHRFVSLAALLAVGSQAAEPQNRPISTRERIAKFKAMSVEELIDKLKEHPNQLPVVQRLRQKGDPKAIPPLEEAFSKVTAEKDREVIASALVALHAKDERYWNYLDHLANKAIESDIPYPLALDSKGNYVRGKQSDEFLAWCGRHRVEPSEAANLALYALPGHISVLGNTNDSRAIPIFLKGLESKNPMIVHESALGLARYQEKSAIPHIIKAVRRLPAGSVRSVADTLVYFDDPEAQKEAEKYITDKALLKAERELIKQKGVKAMFGESE